MGSEELGMGQVGTGLRKKWVSTCMYGRTRTTIRIDGHDCHASREEEERKGWREPETRAKGLEKGNAVEATMEV